MSTTLPGALATHVALPATTLADLLLITRLDGEVLAFAGGDQDVSIGGVTYSASQGLDVSHLASSAGLSVDNLELSTLDDGSVFLHADVLAGRWRNARFLISRYNWASPADGVEKRLAGTFGEVRLHNGLVVAELRGLQQFKQQPIGSVISKTCRARLGDAQCKVDLPTFTSTGAITNVTSRQVFADAAIGGDPYYDSVSLLLHGNGTHGGTTFTDSSSYAHTMTVSAGAPITSTAWMQFGSASIYMNGSSRLTVTHSSLALPGDFTISLFMRRTASAGQHPISWGSSTIAANGGGLFVWSGTNVLTLYVNNGNRITGPVIAANTTYHVTVTRSAGIWSMYVDGTLYGTYAFATSVNEGIIVIGGAYSGGGYWNGYLDEIRITPGVVRAVSVPTVEHQNGPPAYADDWFGDGVLTFTSGANSGLSQKVKTYTDGGAFALSLPMILPVAIGDGYSVVAGCRKRHQRSLANPAGVSDCIDKFNNILNYDGEPHVPGQDAITRPPE